MTPGAQLLRSSNRALQLEGGLTMDKRITLDMPVAGSGTAARPKFKLKNIFGRDWKIAYLFVLPMAMPGSDSQPSGRSMIPTPCRIGLRPPNSGS